MKRSLVSCIVPVFNGERYLAETLDSMFAQTYRPIEIIVVNDGSTDHTADVVAGYGDRVRSLHQDNAGPARARNRGLNAARGEFAAFLDADDLWHPEKLSRQMACFQESDEVDYCVSHVQNFWIPELIEEEKKFRDHRMSKPLPGYVSGTLVVSRDFLNIVGHFNVAIEHADDTEWFLRANERGGGLKLLPDVLLYRRLHYTNLSRVKASNSRDEYLSVVKTALDRRRYLNNT